MHEHFCVISSPHSHLLAIQELQSHKTADLENVGAKHLHVILLFNHNHALVHLWGPLFTSRRTEHLHLNLQLQNLHGILCLIALRLIHGGSGASSMSSDVSSSGSSRSASSSDVLKLNTSEETDSASSSSHNMHTNNFFSLRKLCLKHAAFWLNGVVMMLTVNGSCKRSLKHAAYWLNVFVMLLTVDKVENMMQMMTVDAIPESRKMKVDLMTHNRCFLHTH